MEYLSKRFPLATQTVLNNLDDQSLTQIKEASREIEGFLSNERFYWIRIIRKHTKNFKGFEESWNEAIRKMPVDFIKQLAIAVQKFFQSHFFEELAPWINQVTSSLKRSRNEVEEYSISNLEDQYFAREVKGFYKSNPFKGLTPLHIAVAQG